MGRCVGCRETGGMKRNVKKTRIDVRLGGSVG